MIAIYTIPKIVNNKQINTILKEAPSLIEKKISRMD